ncbi:MAG: geranylgeranylglycerol-phosphate geranylgeranyltransferase [Bacteroidota bacterium]|nr:geranylgeranylglycerol-phosphate geranylgeranyltransferase [Bacteroidota bacterium]MDP3144151.1 geranylgeranylglycerol-phosphate geranylgeranyltransferase [Bacteroidota bacterium]
MNKLLNNKAIAFLKLIRIENLIMIALTQIFLRYFVLQKILNQHQISLELNNGLFYLVVLSTVLIAAAGYIINDYFDMKTDLINHPETVVVGKVIKRRMAIVLHIAFTIIGIFIGMYAALMTGYLRLAIFHIVAATLLWFYSTNFKKQLLVGNIVVSALTAAVAFMPFVYEMGVMQKIHPGFAFAHKDVVLSCFKITFIFSLFAFITSLAREIIKDMEDYKGDEATGGKTMPIVWGMHTSKLNVFFLIVISVILLLFVIYNTFKFYRIIINTNNIYIFIGLIIPLIILAFMTLKAKKSHQFKNASLLLKFIMLTGLSYSIIFYFN